MEKSLIQGCIPPIYLTASFYNEIVREIIITITMFKILRLSCSCCIAQTVFLHPFCTIASGV